ncbi:MAG TPA: hypothetical protein VN026_00855 [Bacteroidia bacterium]|jgi:hypothetical protein|nr:hypothetical protein [Bacteroidia bacterium]
MLEVGQQEPWDALVKRHVQLIHSKSYQYKTTLSGSEPHLYLVVTRVNYMIQKQLKTVKNNQVNSIF